MQAHPGEIQVTVAVVSFKTRMGRIRKGVCSTWLASLNPSNKTLIPIWIKKGSIILPPLEAPMIMIGPGTGCALFKAFLEERNYLKLQGKNVGPNVFFFGCRKETKDFLHQELWKALVFNGSLFLFSVAFSRDQKQKIYVQHKMKENSKVLWNLLQSGAIIYVSGSANQMPKDVKEAFQEVVQQEGGLSVEESENYISNLEKTKRYQVETWD